MNSSHKFGKNGGQEGLRTDPLPIRDILSLFCQLMKESIKTPHKNIINSYSPSQRNNVNWFLSTVPPLTLHQCESEVQSQFFINRVQPHP